MYSDYEKFFACRLAKLRAQKGISARSMRLSLGQNENYIHQIENQKTYPSMQSFFYIYDFLSVTPEEFFTDSNQSPDALRALLADLQQLNDEDCFYTYGIVKALAQKHRAEEK